MSPKRQNTKNHFDSNGSLLLGFAADIPSHKVTPMAKRFFGTDGIRGRVGQSPITPDFAVKLGFATGKVLATQPGDRVVIGKDTRRSGYMLESALEAGLAAAGVDVYLLGDMPTPGVAYMTRAIRAKAGIVISASHNPHYDNGIKFFSETGHKLSDDIELAIEAQLEQPMDMPPAEQLGSAIRVDDAAGRYVEFCKASLPAFSNLRGVNLVVDCANGATHVVAPHVFQELGAQVTVIGHEPDGLNINKNVGSTAPELLQKTVLEQQADIGIALDGDGDRVIMVDAQGQLVDGDEILYILAKESQRHGKLGQGGVVGTLMSNLGLELALQSANIPFARAKVGDRYVMGMLHDKNWYIGGEASGHIIWLNSTTTGDGIVAALQVLNIMQREQKSLRTLLAGMEKCPQVLINVPSAGQLNEQQWLAIHQETHKAEQALAEQGRVLIRPSGTEPLIRVMVEARDAEQAQHHAARLAQFIETL